MIPDPKWLEILKSSGGQAAALAGASGLFLLFTHWGWVNPPDWAIQGLVFLLLLTTFLALVALGSATLKLAPVHKWAIAWFNTRARQREIEAYIPYLTEREQNILGYLLKYNQKVFTAETDGGYAVTLISRGLVVRVMRPGQQASAFDVPFAVPDYVWDVLAKNKDKIVYRPRMKGTTEVHPWRVPSGF